MNAQGFSARWQTSALATSAARDLLADAEQVGEQTALVLGSVLLFAALALVTVVARRVDWYALAAGLRAPPA